MHQLHNTGDQNDRLWNGIQHYSYLKRKYHFYENLKKAHEVSVKIISGLKKYTTFLQIGSPNKGLINRSDSLINHT